MLRLNPTSGRLLATFSLAQVRILSQLKQRILIFDPLETSGNLGILIDFKAFLFFRTTLEQIILLAT